MKHIKFSNGDYMPSIGLGTWKASGTQVYESITNAISLGYRHIDCAYIYQNEHDVGRAIADATMNNGLKREDLWVTSKLWNSFHAPEDVLPALRKSLADLRLNYLDLFLMHWPVAQKKEVVFPEAGADLISLNEIPLHETWTAMEESVDNGLCRHIGVSNFSIAKLNSLRSKCRIKPEINQVELHPYMQQTNMLDWCKVNDIAVCAYSPLGSSDRPEWLIAPDEPHLLSDPVIAQIAREHQCSSAQILIAWALRRGTAVIPKSAGRVHLEENYTAKDLLLSDEDMSRIGAIDKGRRYIRGEFWAIEGSPYTTKNLWDSEVEEPEAC